MTCKQTSHDGTQRIGRSHQSMRMAMVSSLAMLAGAGPTWGQEVAGPMLEEIVVSARKISENLQETPVAVTAFSAEALSEQQVNTIADVGSFIPNVSFQSGAAISGNSASVTTFIRGVGQTDFTLTIDPGVGIYVDGVYVSRSTGALLGTSDVANIQVLRGPQGTLFGKNTIGGAVVITSARPSDELERSVELTTGSYHRADARVMLNVPVSDELRVRISGARLKKDGYVKRIEAGDHMGGIDQVAGRLIAEYTPTEDLTFTYSVDANNNMDEGLGTTLVALDTSNPDGFAFFHNNVVAAAQGANCTANPSDARCFSAAYITGDPYKTHNGSRNESNMHLFGTALTAEWKVDDSLNLKSITAFRRLGGSFDQDVSNTPFVIDRTANNYRQRQFSQEFNASGGVLDGRVDYLIGLFYLQEKGTDENYLHEATGDFTSGGSVDNQSYAAYTQQIVHLTDAANLTVGARYTYEKKAFTPDSYIVLDRTGGAYLEFSQAILNPTDNPNGNGILPLREVTVSAHEFTPAVTFDYQLTEDVLGYASYSKGFKSGGFTQRIFPPKPETPSFEPEFVNAYEAGLKSELFGKRLRLNLAGFVNKYSGMQVVANDTGTGLAALAPKIQNAGKATLQGGEIEADWATTTWLRVNASLGYLDASYDSLTPQAQSAAIALDNKLPYTSKWTGALGFTATLWEGDEGTLSLRADGTFKSGYHPDAQNVPVLFQDGYGVLNASVSYQMLDDQLTIMAGGSNITGTTYQITGYSELSVSGAAYKAYARPAEWFLKLKYDF